MHYPCDEEACCFRRLQLGGMTDDDPIPADTGHMILIRSSLRSQRAPGEQRGRPAGTNITDAKIIDLPELASGHRD